MAAMNDVPCPHLENKENDEAVDQEAKVSKCSVVQPDGKALESVSRGSSPRRVRDIHLDGSADNMPGVDPYMLDNKDLDIQSEADVNAGSIYSDLSGPSWKSLRTPRTKPHSAASSHPRSSIASRARQIKDHEGEPFLSIDLMPQGRLSKSESKQTGQSLRGSSCQTLVSAISSESYTGTQRSGKNGFRLQPLEPVQQSVPTIQQCRGIVAETRTYGQSQSRTFQRWKAIMAGGATAHQHLHHPHLPASTAADVVMTTGNVVVDVRDMRSGSVCESVHQTSQASSPSPTPRDLLNPDIDGEELDYLQDSGDQTDRIEEQTLMEGVTFESLGLMEQGNVKSASLPRSPSGPGHCEEDVSALEGSFACGVLCNIYKAETNAIKDALNIVEDKISKMSDVVSDARLVLESLENFKDTELDTLRQRLLEEGPG
ncbi:hypothetical protein ElyMa_004029100 [Elysia marginata]|uniref:Uncharacterized protein n=1 Tax=Elysia marginata TaxID=1093978 RepID=A0AAV4G3Z9_9GAST|nr:hypothetical protein ElyMa_004029100 [Elysia marginata]